MPLPPTLLARLAKRGIINPKNIKLAGTNVLLPKYLCYFQFMVI